MASGMTEQAALKKTIPPYLPFKTLTTFLEGLKVGMPQRIDRSLMKSMSGTMQSQIMATLEYLRLIDPEIGVPSEKLNQLVHSKGEERQRLLKEILRSSYHFLFKDGLDLENATARQLQEGFEQQGISGDTLRKAVAFFLKAAKEAGFKLSPHFKRTYSKRSAGTKITRKSAIAQESQEADISGSSRQSVGQVDDSIDKILLSKFPDFNPEWSDELKKEWFAAFRDLRAEFKRGSEGQ